MQNRDEAAPAGFGRSFIPLGIFMVLALTLYLGLSLDPRELPSAMLDKPMPTFDLPNLEDGQVHLRSDDLADGQVFQRRQVGKKIK